MSSQKDFVSDDFSNKGECRLPTPERSWVLEMTATFISILLAGVIAKLLYIFFMTRRGMAKSWPYDSYLFEPFHRFTDWLIPWRWADEANPWSVYGELAKMIPPAPYGPGTFWYINFTKSVGPVASFLALTAIFITVCYISYARTVSTDRFLTIKPVRCLMALGCLVGFYPIHFLVDRGNADVIGAIFVAGIFLCFIFPSEKFKCFDRNAWIDLFVVLAICSKPTWGPIVVMSFLGLSPTRVFRVIAGIFLLYAIPVFFASVRYQDYIDSAKATLDIIGGAVAFSNHLYTIVAAAIKVFPQIGGDFRAHLIIGGFGYAVVSVILYVVQRSRLVEEKSRLLGDGLFFGHVLILVLLFNMPSPDYRLTVLLPLVIFLIFGRSLQETETIQNNWNYDSFAKILIILIAIATSWLGFYLKDGFPVFSPVRALCLLLCDILILTYLYRNLKVGDKDICVTA
jgi:hypothetical protein